MLLNIHELHKWEKTSLGLMTFRERREGGDEDGRVGGGRHRHAVLVWGCPKEPVLLCWCCRTNGHFSATAMALLLPLSCTRALVWRWPPSVSP